MNIPVIIAFSLPHCFETEATNYLNVNFHLTPTSFPQAFPSLYGRKGTIGDLEILTTAEIAWWELSHPYFSEYIGLQ